MTESQLCEMAEKYTTIYRENNTPLYIVFRNALRQVHDTALEEAAKEVGGYRSDCGETIGPIVRALKLTKGT